MKTPSRMTLADIRNNGLKFVVALMLAGAPLVTLGLIQSDISSVTIAGGASNPDDVDPG